MAEYNKQLFFWIKLSDRFMTSDTVDFLMSQKDGANYIVIYQMLCLKTVNNDGCLSRTLGEIIVPYDEEKIQRDLKWFSIDTIRVAMHLYKQLGLIYEQDNGILRITDFDSLIGSQTISAEKKKEQRNSRKNALNIEGGQKVDKCPPDIDKEKEKDIDNIIYIVEFLNSTLNTRYRYQTQTTQKLIKARLNEGFTVDDFKTVIDKKAKEWKGTEMEQFLRPETLFGTKFESYLNAPIKSRSICGAGNKTQHFENEREYSTNECNNLLKDIDDINF